MPDVIVHRTLPRNTRVQESLHADPLNATLAIQAAIDSLPAGGGTIRLQPGIYNLQRVPGQPWCLMVDVSNLEIFLEAGALLRLADGQYVNEEGHVFRIGTSGLTALRSNFSIRGPGIIDGNRDNQTLVASPNMSCLSWVGRFKDVYMGDGLQLINAGGAGLRISVSGGTVHEDWRCIGLTILDCNEGFLGGGVQGFIIDQLLIDGMINQDGWEPVNNCRNWAMSDSIIKNCAGSAVDLFSNNAGGGLEISGQTFDNCHFGPARITGSDCIAVGVNQTTGQIVADVIFSGCHLNMGGYLRGFHLGGGTSTTGCKGVVLDGNIVNGAGSQTNSKGIVVGETAQDISINGGQVHGCGDDGLSIAGDGVQPNPDGITVQGGSYFDNDQDAVGGSGIAVEANVGEVAIMGAHCYDGQGTPTQQNGVDVTNVGGGPVHVEVHECVFRNNVNRGLAPVAPPAGVAASNNYGQA